MRIAFLVAALAVTIGLTADKAPAQPGKTVKVTFDKGTSQLPFEFVWENLDNPKLKGVVKDHKDVSIPTGKTKLVIRIPEQHKNAWTQEFWSELGGKPLSLSGTDAVTVDLKGDKPLTIHFDDPKPGDNATIVQFNTSRAGKKESHKLLLYMWDKSDPHKGFDTWKQGDPPPNGFAQLAFRKENTRTASYIIGDLKQAKADYGFHQWVRLVRPPGFEPRPPSEGVAQTKFLQDMVKVVEDGLDVLERDGKSPDGRAFALEVQKVRDAVVLIKAGGKIERVEVAGGGGMRPMARRPEDEK
jgi:hypothetical protein